MKPIIGALAGAIIAYLGSAFVLWNLNPGEWAEAQRGATAFFSGLFAFVGALFAKISELMP
ncbi:hypothetical protein [Paenirhodobacter populi]|uniref:Uncharacterized protein n=1 Tax=Paenirhodobacter populi TaxID=2306993 RepID=A0A443JE69_9RHOB|nr:hypothetical protein [Sinirhodobacter populi]RWR18828.1 hypothetical protein D2T30_15835 [Sinirhodobacter populi]